MWFSYFLYKFFPKKKNNNNDLESSVPLFINNKNIQQTKIKLLQKIYNNDFLSEYHLKQYIENFDKQDLIDIIIYYNMKLQENSLLLND